MLTDFDLSKIKELKKDDMLIYDGKKFVVIPKDDLIKHFTKRIEALEKIVFNQTTRINNLENALDSKIKKFISAFKGEDLWNL